MLKIKTECYKFSSAKDSLTFLIYIYYAKPKVINKWITVKGKEKLYDFIYKENKIMILKNLIIDDIYVEDSYYIKKSRQKKLDYFLNIEVKKGGNKSNE
ncbi:MAG: hypothetical protein ACP6IY_10665 [Promethearchaeia archaeon]